MPLDVAERFTQPPQLLWPRPRARNLPNLRLTTIKRTVTMCNLVAPTTADLLLGVSSELKNGHLDDLPPSALREAEGPNTNRAPYRTA